MGEQISSVGGTHRLCSGANEDPLQKDLCHRPRLPGLLLPESLSPPQATADPCLRRSFSNTHRQVWLSLLWGSLLLSLGPGVHKFLFVPSKCLWRVLGLILNMIVPLPTLLVSPLSLDVGFLFLVGSNILLLMVVQQHVVNVGNVGKCSICI